MFGFADWEPRQATRAAPDRSTQNPKRNVDADPSMTPCLCVCACVRVMYVCVCLYVGGDEGFFFFKGFLPLTLIV